MQKTLLFLWSGVICPHFHVSGTCEQLMMMLLRRSQKGFSMDDEQALTALGRTKSHLWALLGLIFSSTAFTMWCWIGLKANVFIPTIVSDVCCVLRPFAHPVACMLLHAGVACYWELLRKVWNRSNAWANTDFRLTIFLYHSWIIF